MVEQTRANLITMRINQVLEEDKKERNVNNLRGCRKKEEKYRSFLLSATQNKFKVSNRLEISRASLGEYHRAAIDGYVDMLCEASKSDANQANSSANLTPTHLAAFNGQLEALRILVGRGGDPEQTSSNGSSALHLAASQNHLNCVSFLVNFGANMWALNNDLHTAKDIAAMEQKKEVLDYLDQMMAKQSALNTKSVQKLKEKAKLGAEKRLKRMRKAQLKAIKQVERDERYLVKLSNNRRLLKAAHSMSDIKLVGRQQVDPSKLNSFPADDKSRCAASENSVTGSGSGYCSGSSSSERWLSPISSISSSALSGYFGSQVSIESSQRRGVAGTKIESLISARRPSSKGSKLDLLEKMRRPQFKIAGLAGFAASAESNAKLATGQSQDSQKSPASDRPKYSDLVALNLGVVQGEEPISRSGRLQLLRTNRQRFATSSSESTTSSSSVASKLRGVSRKVQLRRLLQMDTNENGGAKVGAKVMGQSVAPVDKLSSEQQPKLGLITNDMNEDERERGIEAQAVAKPQTCSIKPTIKLKLNGDSSSVHLNAGDQMSELQVDDKKGIKWPPAPSLARAISEPDFGAAFRTLAADADEDDEEDDASDAGEEDDDDDGDANEDYNGQNLPAAKGEEKPNGKTQQQVRDEKKEEMRDESQRLLLTQCLSQLKLRHETRAGSTTTISHETSNDPSRSSAQVSTNQAGRTGRQLSNHSDELLQLHQLNSSQFPLKPSVIRQHLSGQQLSAKTTSPDSSTLMFETAIKSEIPGSVPINKTGQLKQAISLAPLSRVDSIGSAGSLADAITSDKSNKSSSSSRSSSITSSQSSKSSLTYLEPSIKHKSCWPGEIVLGAAEQRGEPKRLRIVPNLRDFLRIHGLADLTDVLEREQIDIEALMLLSEEDLRSLNILLGPRRKLLKAIEGQRLIERHEERANSCLAPMGAKCVMVDTQL